MTRLDDYAENDWFTVDGEAGIIAHIFERLGVGSKMAVEFGAGDGRECSNTARLWREDQWTAFLVEPDPQRFKDLEANAALFDTVRRQGFVTPTGPDSIGELLLAYAIREVDFMSIDVDGDDYFIFRAMTCRPRVVCIEFNPTIPPHIDMHQDRPGESFGASLLSIIRAGAEIGYRFVGATRCNAFLVREPDAAAFDGYETDPTVLFPPGQYTYAVTDYHGRIVLAGAPLPWQAKEPYVLPVVTDTTVMPVATSAQHLRSGFEALWGPAWHLTPDGLSPERLTELLVGTDPPLVCIDLTSVAAGGADWMVALAEAHHYRVIRTGPLLGLVHPPASPGAPSR